MEEHGAGKQMGRWRLWSRPSTPAFLVVGLLALLAFPFFGTDFYTQMVARMMILAIFAMKFLFIDPLRGRVAFVPSWIDTGVGLLSPITLNWFFGRSCAAAPDAIAPASASPIKERCSIAVSPRVLSQKMKHSLCQVCH